MPWDDAVTDFVPFAPTLLWLREMGVDEDALPVRNKKRTKIPLLNHVQQQRRPGQDLFARDGEPVRHLAQCSVFGGGIILTIKAEQLADRGEVQRRLGVAKVAENLRHETIDVSRSPFAKENVLQTVVLRRSYFSLKNFTNSSRARCSSFDSFSTDSERAANRTASSPRLESRTTRLPESSSIRSLGSSNVLAS